MRLGRSRRHRWAAALGGIAAFTVIGLLLAEVLTGPGHGTGAGAALGVPDPAAATRIDLKPGPADAVLTGRGDLTRLGLDDAEPTLSPSALTSGHFGKRVAYPVDGKIYAQPLYVPRLDISGAAHNVVVVATEHDSVYAFDADATSAATPPLWHVSLLQPGARTFDAATDRVAKNRLCDSVVPEVGIASTPVIDWNTKTIYVMALDVEQGRMTYRLHALDLYTGADKRAAATVAASVPGTGLDAAHGTVTFTASEQQQRMALTEVDSVVYAGFSSWCGLAPYHGWVLGYSAATLAQSVVYNTSPNAWGAGLWESESGFSVDGHGHLYLVTGNGPFDLDRGGRDAGDSVLETVPQNGTLRVLDSFTPFDQLCRAEHDQDLGSGSLFDVPGAHEYILSSKTGSVYVLSQAGLGGYHTIATPCKSSTEGRTDVDRIKQELTVGTVPGGMWGTWAFWSQSTGSSAEYVYGSGANGRLTQWRLLPGGTIDPTPVAQAPLAFSYPGAIPVVTGDRDRSGSGVVWTVDQTHGATLRAFAAADVSRQLWSSAGDATRDGLDQGEFDHFTVPTTADGLVIIGDQGHLEIYGTLQG
ncbi:hypothetical protein [Actinospica robiniae]|uniref:hypothetical protein n=1 Tax=Actinospica robiniae TaxID=304901 RepID=UPI000416E5D3|nr:hypothetical protein [Actinospica robiniae]